MRFQRKHVAVSTDEDKVAGILREDNLAAGVALSRENVCCARRQEEVRQERGEGQTQGCRKVVQDELGWVRRRLGVAFDVL